MSYDKRNPVAVGKALVELIEATTEDGVGMEDMDELMALISSLKAARPEMSNDTDAATLHILSGASDAFGDKRVNPEAVAPPE